nr:LOW QUALITY PROTEIN: uncharacterized protein LOC112427101 [Macaca nemestrina]
MGMRRPPPSCPLQIGWGKPRDLTCPVRTQHGAFPFSPASLQRKFSHCCGRSPREAQPENCSPAAWKLQSSPLLFPASPSRLPCTPLCLKHPCHHEGSDPWIGRNLGPCLNEQSQARASTHAGSPGPHSPAGSRGPVLFLPGREATLGTRPTRNHQGPLLPRASDLRPPMAGTSECSLISSISQPKAIECFEAKRKAFLTHDRYHGSGATRRHRPKTPKLETCCGQTGMAGVGGPPSSAAHSFVCGAGGGRVDTQESTYFPLVCLQSSSRRPGDRDQGLKC